MKKFAAGLVKKRGGDDASELGANNTPEESATRGVRLFCESGGPNNSSTEGQEYLHLPTIVESAESSPAAAKAAAYQIRKLLKDNYQKSYIQYNAIMLIRILADNPGPSFTKNIDDKFTQAIQTLLQQGRDPSVQHLLMETLLALETEKANDENLVPLMTMWRKERSIITQRQIVPPPWQAPIPNYQTRPRQQRQRSHRQLPPPAELAGRVEEGRMSAQLLTQVTQSTPPAELLKSDLVEEFAGRCQSAQRNLQGYMSCTDPAPDEQTFQTLIETCEQLNVAMSKHQRAVLAARRETTSSPPLQGQSRNQVAMSPPLAPRTQPSVLGPTTTAPQPSIASRNPYYTANGAPSTTPHTAGPHQVVSQSSANPFTDDNKILSRSNSGPQVTPSGPAPLSKSQLYSKPPVPSQSPPPVLASSSFTSTALPGKKPDDNDFQPPPGPPPGRQATIPVVTEPYAGNPRPPSHDSDDLYGDGDKHTTVSSAAASPTGPEHPNQSPFQVDSWPNIVAAQTNPGPAAYSEQYSNDTTRVQAAAQTNPFKNADAPYNPIVAQPQSPPQLQQQPSPRIQTQTQPLPTDRVQMQSTPSYIQRQDAAVSGFVMSGGTSVPSTPATDSSLPPNASGARIKDDDPLTPMSAGAWQTGRY